MIVLYRTSVFIPENKEREKKEIQSNGCFYISIFVSFAFGELSKEFKELGV